MSKQIDWLCGELEAWQREDLVDADQARRIRERYDTANQAEGGWGKVIFAAIGAIVFGLGVILILAYNWEGLHRYSKLGLVILALLLAHGGGWILGRADGRHQRLGESLYLLGTMLFGAGIWLVAQVYHIDGHYPNAFMAWSLVALAMAWVLPSVAQGILAVCLVLLWSWFTVFDFHQAAHWALWLVAFGIIPLAWQQRSRSLLAASLTAYLFAYGFTIVRVSDDLVVSSLLLWSSVCLAMARLTAGSQFPGSAGILRGIGFGVYLALLLLFSFIQDGIDLLETVPDTLSGWLYGGVPLLIALLTWAAVLLRWQELELPVSERLEDAMIMLMVVLVTLSLPGIEVGAVVWLAANLLLLGHGTLCLLRGLRELLWKQLALGCLIIAAVVLARFFDLFGSLLLRSLVFLVLGAALFAIGIFYSRRRQELPPRA